MTTETNQEMQIHIYRYRLEDEEVMSALRAEVALLHGQLESIRHQLQDEQIEVNRLRSLLASVPVEAIERYVCEGYESEDHASEENADFTQIIAWLDARVE